MRIVSAIACLPDYRQQLKVLCNHSLVQRTCCLYQSFLPAGAVTRRSNVSIVGRTATGAMVCWLSVPRQRRLAALSVPWSSLLMFVSDVVVAVCCVGGWRR